MQPTSFQTEMKKATEQWFALQGWKPFSFQKKVWKAYWSGKSGLVHASTGIGKTYAAWMGPVFESFWEKKGKKDKSKNGNDSIQRKVARNKAEPIRVLWLTPLKALAVDAAQAMAKPIHDLKLPWVVETRTGDTSSSLRAKQQKKLPTCLITTPESLSLLLSYQGAEKRFKTLRCVVVDEWHELFGSKRGVMAELALSRLKNFCADLRIWGLSATLANKDQALHALLGDRCENGVLIQGPNPKKIRIEAVIPETVERFPWAGHLGLKMLPAVIERIEKSESILVFTNTRSQAEIWFQAILDARPDLAGVIALHHGSLDRKTRAEVENRLRSGLLKCVVCTSSLELGVDFSPVDRVMQIGSPKGVARLMQRAGRSGHTPSGVSRIYCVPTNALQLVEISAAKKAVETGKIEARAPILLPLDLLTQHMSTLAAGDGFSAETLLEEIRTTFAYSEISDTEFNWALDFVVRGGNALGAYPQFRKVKNESGLHVMADEALARRHRMTIGVIASDADMTVKYVKGGRLGSVEESFASKLRPGDRFIFAGKALEAVKIRDMTLYVKKTKLSPGPAPQWMGGRMPLSTQLSSAVRECFHEASLGRIRDPAMKAVKKILETQSRWSEIPSERELLIEHTKTREGSHLFIYPFEGRLAHEGLSAMFAFRISRISPISLSFAVNDYGIELFSDRTIPIAESLKRGVFSPDDLEKDIEESLNLSEMARRRFREIARISGLVFPGYPGKHKTNYQLQTSSGLLFNVFQRYDPKNLLIVQAKREVMASQLEILRLSECLERINGKPFKIVETPQPTPLAFPLMVDRLRSSISSEKLYDRIQRMQNRLEKEASRNPRKKKKTTEGVKNGGNIIPELIHES